MNVAEKKHYIGVDIGGMSIKGIIIDGSGNELAQDRIATGCEDGGSAMCKNIIALIDKMMAAAAVEKSTVVGVGIGCPGLIDSKNGIVVFAGNLGLENFPLAKAVKDKIKLPVKLTNDANAAALGEAKFGAGQKYSDSIMVTLGTGVGGGIVIDGKLFEGGSSAGTEIGHMVIETGGYPCTCGRKGCFECYASATALMRKTKEAMEADTSSEMWKTYTPQTVTGRTPFLYAETDITARQVVDWYVKHLACGVANLANIFRPQVIMLGGGVSEQGDKLTIPVQKQLDKELFAGTEYAPVKVVKASLGSKAGAFGAAALWFN
jgi:glucokinase